MRWVHRRQAKTVRCTQANTVRCTQANTVRCTQANTVRLQQCFGGFAVIATSLNFVQKRVKMHQDTVFSSQIIRILRVSPFLSLHSLLQRDTPSPNHTPIDAFVVSRTLAEKCGNWPVSRRSRLVVPKSNHSSTVNHITYIPRYIDFASVFSV